MVKNSDPKESTKYALDIASDALIAEYNAMRAAKLSRDQIWSSLTNFMMIVYSAIVVSLPTIISQKQYLLLPFLSLVLAVLALSNRAQTLLMRDLIEYEVEVLRPKLQSLLKQASHPNEIPDGLGELWEWENYHQRKRLGGSILSRVFRRFTHSWIWAIGDLHIGWLSTDVCLLPRRNWTLVPETVVFWFAVICCVWLVGVYVYTFVADLKTVITKQR